MDNRRESLKDTPCKCKYHGVSAVVNRGVKGFGQRPCRLDKNIYPQWSLENRPIVVMSKPANGCSPRPCCFTSLPPDEASPFWFTNSVGRICERDCEGRGTPDVRPRSHAIIDPAKVFGIGDGAG